MYDSEWLNKTMFGNLEKIDKWVMDNIIDPIAKDISEVAQELLSDQFDDIMDMLSFENSVAHPGVESISNKLTQKS